MKWLSENYKWLFDGAGGAVVIAVIGFIIHRLGKSPRQQAVQQSAAALQGMASSVRNSPLASGSGNIQTINAPIIHAETVNLGHPLLTAAPAEPLKATRSRPNIQFIDVAAIHLNADVGGYPVMAKSEPNAIVIRFANEPRQVGRNIESYVTAILLYREGPRELCDLIGIWLDDDIKPSAFKADGRRHSLLAGVLFEGRLVVLGRRREIAQWGSRFLVAEPHRLNYFQSGVLFVRLMDDRTHDLLYEGEFEVRVNPLSIAPLQAT